MDVIPGGNANSVLVGHVNTKTGQKSVASARKAAQVSNTDDSIGDSGLVVSTKDYKSYPTLPLHYSLY